MNTIEPQSGMHAGLDPEGLGEALLGSLPAIRRTRGWRMYAGNGRRYLDLWLDGGRAIQGTDGGTLRKTIKAALDRGLTRPFPSDLRRRAERALLGLWTEYQAVVFFETECAARNALAGMNDSQGAGFVPGYPRPFGEFLRDDGMESQARSAMMAVPLLPSPALFMPGVVLLRDPGDRVRFDDRLVEPLLLAALSRSIADYVKFRLWYCEAHWKRIDPFIAGLFRRTGPYLLPIYPEEQHATVFSSALERGIVLSPYHRQPSLIPGEFDRGEVQPLRDLVSRI